MSSQQTTPQTAPEVFDQTYLDIRAWVLQVAAALDRIDRSEEADAVNIDRRRELIQQGVEVLGQPGRSRAEQIQMIFSDPYLPGWNESQSTE